MEELTQMYEIIRNTLNAKKITEPNNLNENATLPNKMDSIVYNSMIRFGFWGSFKTGKTSLINALLNIEILPARVLSATGNLTRIHYASSEQAIVFFKDGRRARIPVEEAEKYILIKEKNLDGASIDESVMRIDIGLPIEMLKSIDIYDFPGDEDVLQLSEQASIAALQMDVVVVVLSSLKLFSQKERINIDSLYRQLKGNLIIVINKTDYLTPEELDEVKSYVCQVISEKYSNNIDNNIHFCSTIELKEGIIELTKNINSFRDEPYWIINKKIFQIINNNKKI